MSSFPQASLTLTFECMYPAQGGGGGGGGCTPYDRQCTMIGGLDPNF